MTLRPWIYRIWKGKTGTVMNTRGPKDAKGLAALIKDHGEFATAIAWALYVHAEPPAYNLEPVKHVDEFTSKKGNKIVTAIDDESAITRFPFASFLTTAESYVLAATDLIDAIQSGSQGERISAQHDPAVIAAKTAMAKDCPPLHRYGGA